MNKLTPFTFLLCIFFITGSQADDKQSVGTPKEQVLGLLDTIESRNKLIDEKLFGSESGRVSQSRATNISTAEKSVPVSYINPNIHTYVNGVRDPFAITQEISLLSEVNNTTQDTYAEHSFKSSGLAFTLPKLTMKGVVFKKQEKLPIALLEIGGSGVYMVKVGDEISFNPATPKQVIKIIKISRSNVVVEVGTLGDLIVVR